MLFNSFAFLHFFLIVYAVFLAVRDRPALWKPWLLLASYAFYMSWNAPFVLLLIGTSTMDYAIGRRLGTMTSPGGRRVLLAVSVVANLGILCLFKYYAFARENLHGAAGLLGIDWGLPPWRFVLPLGISFYTFHSLGYTFDCYRRTARPCTSLLDFLLFVAFFPQLVAGPILRASGFLPQLARKPTVCWRSFYHGLGFVLAGFVKKTLIADRLAPFADTVYGDPGRASFASAWLGTYAFAVQIYCDFSGYSDMARGLARMMGFRVPRNFRRPYLSGNPREFWRRWHITLSNTLRDYLYKSLGGDRLGPWRTRLNVLVTMLLGGIWHGANWTFVVWGAFHGLWLILHRAWSEGRARNRLLEWVGWRPLAALATFHGVCLGWVWFRAPDMHAARVLLGRMLRPEWGTPLPIGALTALLAAFAALQWGLLDRLVHPRFFRARPLASVAGTGLVVWALLLYGAPQRVFLYFAF